MTWKKLFPFLLCCLFLTACWDADEPERLVYVNGVGIDYKDGKMVIYLQIFNMSSLAKTQGGSGTMNRADIGRAEGKTLDEALFNLYHTTNRRVFWGHLTYVVFTEEALRHNMLQNSTDLFDRYRETRYHTYFFVTASPLEKVMSIGPVENISLAFSKLTDPKDTYKQSSLIRPVSMRDLIIKLNEPTHQAALPFIKIKKEWIEESSDKTKDNFLIEEYAVVERNKYIGVFPKDKIQGARFNYKDFTRDNIDLYKGTDKAAGVIIYDKKAKVTPVIKEGKATFKMKLTAKASMEIAEEDMNRKEIQKDIAKAIRKELLRTYHFGRKKNVDVYRLSETLYRQNNKTWKKIEHDGLIPLEEDTIESIDIDVQLQNAGKHLLLPILR